jgi:hypothetical protein
MDLTVDGGEAFATGRRLIYDLAARRIMAAVPAFAL